MSRRLLYILLLIMPSGIQAQHFALKRTYKAERTIYTALAYLPAKDTVIAATAKGDIYFCGTHSDKLDYISASGLKNIALLSVSDDGKWIAACDNAGNVRIWSVKGLALKTKANFGFAPTFLFFDAPARSLIAGGPQRVAKLSLQQPGKAAVLVKKFYTDGILSPHKTSLLLAGKKSVDIYSLKEKKITKSIPLAGTVKSIAAKDSLLVIQLEDSAMIYNLASSKPLFDTYASGTACRPVFSMTDGYYVSGDSDNMISVGMLNDKDSIVMQQRLKGHTGTPLALCMSKSNDKIFSIGKDSSFRIWKYIEPKDEAQDSDVENYKVQLNADHEPVSINDRKVNVEGKSYVGQTEVEFHIWDDDLNDGDIISLNLNGKWVLRNFTVTKNIKLVTATLDRYKPNLLVMYAHNLGSIPPNTAKLSFFDGEKQQVLSIKSDLSMCGAIRFLCK